MRTTLVTMAAAALLAGAAGVAAAQSNAPDFKAECEKLAAYWQDADTAFWDAYEKAGTEEARAKLKHPAGEFAPRFRDLAARAKGTASALKCHVWLLGQSGGMGEPDPKVVAESLDAILADHIGSPDLEEFARGLPSFPIPPARAEAAYQAILSKSPHAKVKAAAMLARANAWLESPPSEEGKRVEGKKLLAAVAKDYADTDYGKEAKGFLFEMERLQLDMEIPDFEATDQSGKKFKLSEYRGKVVVVDFWGFW